MNIQLTILILSTENTTCFYSSEMGIGLKQTFLRFLGFASDFAISKVLTLVTLTAYVYLTHNTLTLEVRLMIYNKRNQ